MNAVLFLSAFICGHIQRLYLHFPKGTILLNGPNRAGICDARPDEPLSEECPQAVTAIVNHTERLPHVRFWAQPGNILPEVAADPAAVRIKRKDDFSGQIILMQPGRKGRRNRPAPVWRADKDHGMRTRRMGYRKEPRIIPGFRLPLHLTNQLRKCRGVGLPRMDLTPVTAYGGLDALRDPMCAARIGIGNDQWAIRCIPSITCRHCPPFRRTCNYRSHPRF